MNDKQKIFVMVGVGSLVLFILSIAGLELFHTDYGLESMFQGGTSDNLKTNYIGLIAVFNVVVSITGFFLFKDK